MSGDGLPFDAEKAKLAMKELMKTPEGREIANKIKSRLKDLDVAFQGLKNSDKAEFMKKFKGKFSETFDDLRESIKKNIIDSGDVESDDPSFEEDENIPNNNFNVFQSSPQPNYLLFLVAFLIILLLFC